MSISRKRSQSTEGKKFAPNCTHFLPLVSPTRRLVVVLGRNRTVFENHWQDASCEEFCARKNVLHSVVAEKTTRALLSAFIAVAFSSLLSPVARGQADIDLGPITERHEMIPMRDGNRLSAYLYFPPGSGPWPAVFEQRYADLRGAATRKAAAKLAEAGYVVALVNFRGTH